jgi:membrane associated rhomboid family serine protease
MRSASVGQQCVECVKESNQGARPAQNVFGGRARAGGGMGNTGVVVTWALMAINVLLFIVELARPSLATDWAMLGYASYAPGGPMHGVAAGEWYRLITSAFLPPAVTGSGASSLGLLDILFNMWALWIVGPTLERVLGPTRFLAVYVVSAVGGSVMYYYIAEPNVLALGASGAIFGLFAALLVVVLRRRQDPRGVITLLVINLVFSFIYRSEIAWQAHVGGLLAGALITAVYVLAPRKNRVAVQVAATVAVLILAGVAVALRSHQLTSAGF